MAGVDNFKLILQDVLKVDLKALIAEEFPGMPVAVCANLPYYITSPIVSASSGGRRSSTSMDTTLAARFASSRVSTPMPGPISMTP